GVAQSLDLVRRARARGHDPGFRPHRDGWRMRMMALSLTDIGAWNKGMLAGWGIDQRDPTADRRLIEFCLSVPPREYLRGGRTRSLARRALADRLPAELLDE